MAGKTQDAKLFLARTLQEAIRKQGITQAEAARRITKRTGIPESPSQISLVVNKHLTGFSLERLGRMCRGLGTAVYVVVGKTHAAL